MPDSAYTRIYAAVRRIPAGKVSTYGRIAELAGASGPRQVGYALHSAGTRPDVPWHRVVNASGMISVGEPSATTQRLMLHAEGIEFDGRGRIDLIGRGWAPRKSRKTKARR